jgi:hypothetical protein
VLNLWQTSIYCQLHSFRPKSYQASFLETEIVWTPTAYFYLTSEIPGLPWVYSSHGLEKVGVRKFHFRNFNAKWVSKIGEAHLLGGIDVIFFTIHEFPDLFIFHFLAESAQRVSFHRLMEFDERIMI